MLEIRRARGEDERPLPELPEVETVRRASVPHLVGRRLRRMELQRDDLRWTMPKQALGDLVGRLCTAILRRSKYLLMHFDGPKEPIALIHLGMTGRLLIDKIAPRKARPDYRRHEHWRMDFGDRLVRFIDPRRFGALDVAEREALSTHPRIVNLGQEPLEPAFDGAFLKTICRHRKVAIKQLLMNGNLLVGVGNIYASESCWHARVRPRRAAKSLSLAECCALAQAVRQVLTAAIEAGGTSFRDYVGVTEQAGYFARELRVYDRATQPCPRCHTAIRKTTEQGRSTFWCSGCQH